MWDAIFKLLFGRRKAASPRPAPASAGPRPSTPPKPAPPPQPAPAQAADPPAAPQPAEPALPEAPPADPVAAPPAAATHIEAFTVDLVAAMFTPATRRQNIAAHLPRVLAALANQKLTDPDMALVALATIRAESEGFAPISEGVSKYNTDPGAHPFNKYDSRGDLGNTGPPDGERYKGRGFVQLTGRNNYKNIGALCGMGDELVNNPDRANDPDVAAALLAGFLKRAEPEMRAALAAGDLARVRRAVNGGSHGLDRFKDAFEKGRQRLA